MRGQRTVALIVTPQYLPLLGGMERECALLAAEFARRGFDPVIVTEQLGMPIPREQCDGATRVYRIPSSSTRSFAVQIIVAVRIALLVLRFRRRAAFAIVRTTTLPALVVGLLKKLRLAPFPTLVTAETGGDADDVVALSRRPLFPLSRALVSANDVLNGICRANVDHLREHGFPEAKITHIPNGIDTAPWDATSAPRSVRRFLFLGRLDLEKGLLELLEAFGDLRSLHPEASLTIAGEGSDGDRVQARCRELGLGDAVAFPGRIEYERLSSVLRDHDCLVLASYSEGMPLSVLEAAAHRRVLVLSDVGDFRTMFGDRARIVPPRDAVALAAAMNAAASDPHPAAEYQGVIDQVAIESVAQAILGRLGVGGPPPPGEGH